MIGTAGAESLGRLLADLVSGTTTPAEYLQRLEERFGEVESSIHAFVPEPGRRERLRGRLRALEATAGERPPLYGVPIGVKDIFRVDGIDTVAGSRLPSQELEGPESRVVTTLQAAGAIVLGKTVTTEFAYFAPGPTRNPHDIERTPGGSSSGSAAAVAAGLCPLALGTQTIGSIGRPASYCGVVGFKPSYGRISTEGVIPLAPSLDHVGLFTRDVSGVEAVASLLCDGWRKVDAPVRRPRLAVPEGPYLGNASGEALAGFRATLTRLEEAGYTVCRLEALDDFAAVDRRHRRLVAAEAARVHARWFARYADLYRPETRQLVERGLEVADTELDDLAAGRRELRQRLEESLGEHQADLWLSPSAPGPAPVGLDATGDPVMNLPWTHAGLPTLSLPAWEIDGLPMGLQIAGRFGADEELIAWSSGLEEALAA